MLRWMKGCRYIMIKIRKTEDSVCIIEIYDYICIRLEFLKIRNMERELVLKVMKEAGKPIAAGEVATLSGLDRKVVDKVFAELKKEGAIVSPVRCKWTPAE